MKRVKCDNNTRRRFFRAQAKRQMEMFWKKIIGKSLFNIFFLIPLMLLVQIPVFLAGVSLATYLVYSQNLGEIPSLVSYEPKTVSTFYADDGTVIGSFYKQKRLVVDLEQIPPHVVNAFLAAEDARFFEHPGVDWLGLARATVRNLMAGRIVQGGSTITMQVPSGRRECLAVRPPRPGPGFPCPGRPPLTPAGPSARRPGGRQ